MFTLLSCCLFGWLVRVTMIPQAVTLSPYVHPFFGYACGNNSMKVCPLYTNTPPLPDICPRVINLQAFQNQLNLCVRRFKYMLWRILRLPSDLMAMDRRKRTSDYISIRSRQWNRRLPTFHPIAQEQQMAPPEMHRPFSPGQARPPVRLPRHLRCRALRGLWRWHCKCRSKVHYRKRPGRNHSCYVRCRYLTEFGVGSAGTGWWYRRCGRQAKSTYISMYNR